MPKKSMIYVLLVPYYIEYLKLLVSTYIHTTFWEEAENSCNIL